MTINEKKFRELQDILNEIIETQQTDDDVSDEEVLLETYYDYIS